MLSLLGVSFKISCVISLSSENRQASSSGSRERARASAPVPTNAAASGSPSIRPVNSNPTTPAIEAKRMKRPRYNTKERARKCITYTGIGRKCSDIPFSTEILDRYLAALADTSPTIDIAPVNRPRTNFLKAVKRHT
ncbi:hypothetical protein PENANT_c140G01051, partial [Penicillium antarcticum]